MAGSETEIVRLAHACQSQFRFHRYVRVNYHVVDLMTDRVVAMAIEYSTRTPLDFPVRVAADTVEECFA